VANDYLETNAVITVDNLPCELPRDASEYLGKDFFNFIGSSFFYKDKCGVLRKAGIFDKHRNLTLDFLIYLITLKKKGSIMVFYFL